MNSALADGEHLVKDGPANLQRGIESVGGRLYLTNRRLIFESHRFNVQRGATTIDLTDVGEVRGAWTKFLNVLPLAPNAIDITVEGGEHTRVACSGRAAWLEAITSAREGGAGGSPAP